ncbi:hypothetical protein [Lysobacter solisilvae (ex Woo and Kim 2020)]|uniref:Uncharacterized protein n=1 Tax=Agrilutibacter terrestris TaxID=2865112 RepID=A0A7H0FVN7_9GAMM|nr:hypothetical protein [Lysobacter terrestris]QNP40103.1 hypothetical protein H8B22_11445 [Lysobacter terrestris]
MSQNLASVHFDATQWQGVDDALTALESSLGPVLVALQGTGQRRRLAKMGDGSEAFCRKALDAMRSNRNLLPGVFDLDEMGRDLADHDALNVRLTRLVQLVEKVRDTDMALGSDVMVAALAGYHYLKAAGKGEGLDAVNRDMGKRFEGGERTPKAEPATA